jgi:uncharacterized protein
MPVQWLKQLWGGQPAETQLRRCRERLAAGDAVAAVRELRTLVQKRGNAEALLLLSDCYQNGQGVPVNASESFRLLNQAAHKGSLEAADRLGGLYLFGTPDPNITERTLHASHTQEQEGQDAVAALFGDLRPWRNYTLATLWHQKAALQGVANAQAKLGLQYALGLGVEQNLDSALKYLRAAADGSELGLALLAMVHLGGFGGPYQPEIAREVLSRIEPKKNALCDVLMAITHLEGDESQWRAQPAAKLLHPHAESGHVPAMYYLGELYRRGHLPDHQQQAKLWLRRAAAQGHIKAVVALVRLLTTGDQQFPLEAAALCRQAADQGESEAMFLMAHLYLQGKGVKASNEFAFKWAQQSFEAGFEPARELLAWMHANALGVERNPELATDLLKAAPQLSGNGQDLLNLLQAPSR